MAFRDSKISLRPQIMTHESTSFSPPPSTARRAVQTIGRLAVAGAVLAAGCWTLTRFPRLLEDREPVSAAAAEPAAPRTVPEPAAFETLSLAQLGGSWEFVGGGWSLAVGTTSAPRKAEFSGAPVDRGGPLPPQVDSIERSLADLFDRLPLTQLADGASRQRYFASEKFEAYAHDVPVGNTSRLICARGLVQTGADQWTTIELRRASMIAKTKQNPPLMPNVAAVELLAVRRGPEGAVVGEFSKAALTIDQLLDAWRSAGVQVTTNETYGLTDTREGVTLHDGRLLRLILWDPGQRGDTTILVLDTAAAAH